MQILRDAGLFAIGEVGRGANDRKAHGRPNRHQDHVLGQVLARADAGVRGNGRA